MSEKSSFFSELKRRDVYRVAIAHGVISRRPQRDLPRHFPSKGKALTMLID